MCFFFQNIANIILVFTRGGFYYIANDTATKLGGHHRTNPFIQAVDKIDENDTNTTTTTTTTNSNVTSRHQQSHWVSKLGW